MKKIFKKNLSAKSRINLIFILVTAAILLVGLITASVLDFVFLRIEKIIIGDAIVSGIYWIFIFMATSLILGIVLALLLGKFVLSPTNAIIDGMTRLAEGDYKTRIQLGQYEGMKTLADSFNTLAQELENTELLRNDFINEFSHEMNTPLLSISGLITLLKNEKLSPEKRKQYLEIMEEETKRLSEMTSNSLYLSKLESQEILTSKNHYNLSEQIRNSVLLLEQKWSKKSIVLSLDFDEHQIFANEDMLKQVFVNIIDNAIKFSVEGGELSIRIDECEKAIAVEIENTGPEIPPSEREAIFGKFYQCDKSRSTRGNGIGLSIVKEIVSLHKGKVTVDCHDGKTVFCVTLPKN